VDGEIIPGTKDRPNLMPENYPEIMTINETADYLRISLSSLYKLAQDGRIPCQKVGRHWRFRKQALDCWLVAYPQSGISTKFDNAGLIGE
jgi:excisionase family DNA binding protein